MSSTAAYVTVPRSGSGPGVLVLHAWWGLTPDVKALCDQLADEGFVALAPDLFGGRTTTSPAEGEALLAEVAPETLVLDVRTAADALRRLPATPDAPIGVLGLSMGGSMGLWLSDRAPDAVGATVVFYGTQDVAFEHARSAYLCHFADDDALVSDDEATFLEAVLHLGDATREVEVHRYPGTRHWFFEPSSPHFDPEAAELAWERTLAFLRRHLTHG